MAFLKLTPDPLGRRLPFHLVAFVVLFNLSCYGAIDWTIIHFLRKYW